MEAAVVEALPKCKGCGKDVAIHAQSGRPRKWCSNACRSKNKYIHRCVDCGKVWRSGSRLVRRCRPCGVRKGFVNVALAAGNKVCAGCGEVLAPTKVKWCSNACRSTHARNQHNHRCVDCGKVWRSGRKNSKRCMPCRNRENFKKGMMVVVKKPCEICGVLFVCRILLGNHRYCCECGKKHGKEVLRAHRSKRRAQKRNNGPHENVIHRVVFERDGWVCGICCEPVLRDADALNPLAAQLDHIIPTSRGGTNVYGNSQCAHRLCNQKKYSKDFALIKRWVMTKKRATGQTVSGSLMVGW